jgi:hypothetical protein
MINVHELLNLSQRDLGNVTASRVLQVQRLGEGTMDRDTNAQGTVGGHGKARSDRDTLEH